MLRAIAILTLALLTTACDELEGLGSTEPAAKYPPLPEEVLAVADPRQPLELGTLLEEDRCYWYEHRNVVETTYLPLRTTDGRHICLAEEPVAVAESS